MPNVLDHLTRSAMCLRGYRRLHHPTSFGMMHGLEWSSGRSGSPMVMLHGWGSAGVHHVLAARGARHRVSRLLLPDLLGHGFSDAPADLTAEQLEHGLTSMLLAWTSEPLLLVASSLGGLAAVRFALRHPECVRALFLVSPLGAPLDDGEMAELIELVGSSELRRVKAFLDRLAPRPQRRNWVFAPEMRRIFRRPALRSLLRSTSNDILLSREERAQLKRPVTLVWGQRESLFDERHLDFWRELPDVEVLQPPFSGHAPSVDQPFWFERALRRFIRTHSRPSKASLHGDAGVDLPRVGMQRLDTTLGAT